MKIKEGFVARQVAGENIIVGESVELINFNRMIVLNNSAMFLWNTLVGKEFTTDDAVKAMVGHYNIDETTAKADVEELLSNWKQNGLLE